MFCTTDEHFSAGGEHIENMRSNFSPPYSQLSTTFKQN